VVLALALAGPLLYELYFLLPLARRRRAFLVTSLVANLGLLGFFKYFNFFTDNVYGISDLLGLGLDRPEHPILSVALPVGISFYTFQTMSYTIDVFRNQCGVERHLGRFALYVSFYPQLVAGPIERARHLLPQISERQRFDPDRVADGVRLMFWGLFKKVCIADRLAIYVDSVYNSVGQGHSGPTYLLATYFFAWQIYCDFSGYTDIARGAAKVMGFDLMENFRRPYFAQTITEFWRRWHISLSSWLRDYLYIPLGGNRKGVSQTYINLMITMLLGGLWHGASWNFVVWGGLQGVMLAFSKATLPARERLIDRLGLPRLPVAAFRIFVTFHLCCLSWIFFRAIDLQDSIHIITHIPTGWPDLRPNLGVTVYAFAFLAVLLAVQVVQERRGPVIPMIDRLPLPVRCLVYLGVLFSIVLFGVDGGAQFIYFTF
jgi:alginate O-acetyltransferase complex protein AlgI